jgi:Glycine-rich domain-containing protein-like/WWE domain
MTPAPMMNSPPPYQFCVGLVSLAKQHIEFLRALHEHGISLSRPSLESLRRYRDLWLPLVHQHSQELLIPPADIAWLWHCHRLAPFRYSSYCKACYGGNVLEVNPPFTAHFARDDEVFGSNLDEDKIQDMVGRTVTLWNDQYPNESFHPSEETRSSNDHQHSISATNNDTEAIDENLLLDGFDLLSSTDRQAGFLWQVSAPSFSDLNFLQEGLVNYHKFLYMKKMTTIKDMIIVPTFQIDLFWHTHILSSMAGYYRDCIAIIGSPLHHDDGFDDRSEGGALDVAYTATKEAWKKLYGEEYHVEGGMYRGEPPTLYYQPEFVFESTRMNQYYMQPTQEHPFNQFIGVQGASSTTPAPESAGAYSMKVIWCWRETKSQMKKHPPTEIVGHPNDCWIRFSPRDNETLEAAFQQYGGSHRVAIGNGNYEVEFSTMKQTRVKTGYKREVKRCVETSSRDEKTSTIHTVSTANITSRSSSSNNVAVATPITEWTDPRGLTDDGEWAFIMHAAKCRQRGVNYNPMKINYIFGNESCGLGYYHVTTREAYRILDKRMKARARRLEHDIACEMCCNCGSTSKTPYVVKKEKQLQELLECQQIVKARAKVDRPVGELEVPGSTLTSLASSKNYRRNDYYADNGAWLFPAAFYDAGGGCGAVGVAGGGCGGGACGAGETIHDNSVMSVTLQCFSPYFVDLCRLWRWWLWRRWLWRRLRWMLDPLADISCFFANMNFKRF